jgi:hypothetical protein
LRTARFVGDEFMTSVLEYGHDIAIDSITYSGWLTFPGRNA